MATLSAQQFLDQLAPLAIRVRQEGSPMFPSVRLAQNLLETGGVIHSWNNLGGIMVGSGKPNPWWDGSSVNKKTWEVENGVRVDTIANFRKYKSVYDFYKDQDRLFENTRYERVRIAISPEEQAQALKLSGYATDPNYASKLINIFNQYSLKKYDNMEVEEPMTAAEKEAMEAMVNRIAILEELVKKLTTIEERKEAPKWFVKEFGSGDVGGLISDPNFTDEGWRIVGVALRADKLK